MMNPENYHLYISFQLMFLVSIAFDGKLKKKGRKRSQIYHISQCRSYFLSMCLYFGFTKGSKIPNQDAFCIYVCSNYLPICAYNIAFDEKTKKGRSQMCHISQYHIYLPCMCLYFELTKRLTQKSQLAYLLHLYLLQQLFSHMHIQEQ